MPNQFITLVALKAHRYGGKAYKEGDQYDARTKDVRILEAFGLSKPAPEPADAPKRRYKRRDLKAETA